MNRKLTRVARVTCVAALLWALPCQSADVPTTQPALTDAQKARLTPAVLAFRKAKSAVVNISAQKVVEQGRGIFGDDPLDQVFPGPLQRRKVQSLGTGVIVHPSGYIVTNAHVVRRAQKITITLYDQSELDAKIISADPAHDLAVLKINPPASAPLAYLPLGRSDDLMVGETVIAIGNPMGYADSLTTGVVSATDRELEFGGGLKYPGLIQTSAPINPGNSGGPLLNVNGEFIGINTAIRGDAQNIGFAIPVDALAANLANLLDFERINRVVFGAVVMQRHGLGPDELVVTDVRPGTPAEGKLRKGDRLLALGKTPLAQISDYTCVMLGTTAGEPIQFRCLREGKEIGVEVAPAVKPRPDGKALAKRLLGVTLRPLDKEIAEELHLNVDRGLLVMNVEEGSPAGLIGVRKKDVLFQMAQFYIKDLDELGTILEDVAPGSAIRIGIVRGNVAAWAPVKLRSDADSKKPEKEDDAKYPV